MAFLDNSGDIILDAVLTDAGRARLARGDGSFKIAKYAFGDDEIDYTTFNSNHSSGSAYYDLEILQSPVLEAFTNNTANMKSKLISLSNNNLLYLPVIKLNTSETYAPSVATGFGSGSHVVLVNQDTYNTFKNGVPEAADAAGNYINGVNPGSADTKPIRVDQGLDTTELSSFFMIDPELKETQYIIEMDNRFGSITSYPGAGASAAVQTPAFIDDDSIASYYISNAPMVKNLETVTMGGEETDTTNANISGPRGTRLIFSIKSSVNLTSSDYLFTKLGTSTTAGLETAIYTIDTTIRVTGATTGYRIDIPVRFLKKQ
jgi:hypothetical protein